MSEDSGLWFHYLRHTFASWYKLEKPHISKTGDTAKMIWDLFEKKLWLAKIAVCC
ncbi:MAG: hypothetical protein WBX22_15380 [Silvibacterium sp.]|jgi:hypothetical protein